MVDLPAALGPSTLTSSPRWRELDGLDESILIDLLGRLAHDHFEQAFQRALG